MCGHLSDTVSMEPPRQGSAPPFVGVTAKVDDGSLMAEADHRIANHFALLTGYVRLKAADLAAQSAEPSRESVRMLLKGIGAQIDAVARLHRSLVTNGPASSVDLSEHLHDVCAPFMSGLSGGVTLVEDFQRGCVVRPDQMLPLSQIVAEVVTNAVKHAKPTAGTGVILARCRQDDAGAVLIEVIDNGGGLPETFDPKTDGGLGFRLLRALGKRLGARIDFESTGRGLHFRLRLPPAAAQKAF